MKYFKLQSIVLLIMTILIASTQAINASDQPVSFKSNGSRISAIKRSYPLYDAGWTGMSKPTKLDSGGKNENIMKFSINGQTAFCVQADMQYYASFDYTHKLTGKEALAWLRTKYIGLQYSDAEILQLQRIASVSYGYNNDTSDNMYAAAQILMWKVKHPNGISNIPSEVQSKINEVNARLKVWDKAVSWNNHTVQLKGYGKKYAQTLNDTNGVFEQYTQTFISPGLHLERKGNQVTVWADQSMAKQGNAKFQALYTNANNDLVVYASDNNQTLAVLGKVETPSAGFNVSVCVNPQYANVNAKKETDSTLHTQLRMTKKDAVTGEPLEGIHFAFYRDAVDSEHWIGEGLTDKDGKIALENEVVEHFTSNEYAKQYCTNMNELDNETKKTVLTKEMAQNEVNQKAQADLDAKVQAFQSAKHTYYAVETKTKKAYYLDAKNNIMSKDLSGNGNVEFNVENTPIQGKIQVTKKGPSLKDVSKNEDGTIASFNYEEMGLQGAEFDIIANEDIVNPANQAVLYEKGKIVDHIKTDPDGKAVSKNLYLGTYLVKETKIPKGYKKAQDTYKVVLTAEDADKKLLHVNKTIVNDCKHMHYSIFKQTEDKLPIPDVIFGLYAKEDIRGANGDILISKNTLITKAVSDKNGNVNFKLDLPLYEFYIEEISCPDGFIRKKAKTTLYPYEKNVYTITNKYQKGKFLITKKGEALDHFEKNENNQITAFIYKETGLQNAEFDIIANKTIKNPLDGSIWIKKDAVVDHIKTDAKGFAETKTLPLGEYRIEETKMPKGYLKSEDKHILTLSADGSNEILVDDGTIINNMRKKLKYDITKRSALDKKKMSGAVFALYADEDIQNAKGDILLKKGDMITTAESDEKGKVDFQLDLPYGNYFIKEMKTPVGFVPSKAAYKIKADQQNAIDIQNQLKYGQITLMKEGDSLQNVEKNKDGTVSAFIYAKAGLANAEFDIIADEDIINPVDNSVLIKKGSVVDHLKTDGSGKGASKKLYIGKYRIMETKAPAGYLKNNKEIIVDVEADENKDISLSSQNIYNERQKFICRLHKKAMKNGKDLPHACFGIYAKETIYNHEGLPVVQKGDLLMKQSSNAQGIVEFDIDLPRSVYEIKEIAAPNGYDLNREAITMDVTNIRSQNETYVFKQDFYNSEKMSISSGVNSVLTSYFYRQHPYLISLLLCTMILSILFIMNKKK